MFDSDDPIINILPPSPHMATSDPMDVVRSEARLVSKLAHVCGAPSRERLLQILAAAGRLQAAVAVAAGVELAARKAGKAAKC